MIEDRKLIADALKIAGANIHLVGEVIGSYRNQIYLAKLYPARKDEFEYEFEKVTDALSRFVVSGNVQFLQDYFKYSVLRWKKKMGRK